MVAAPMLAMPGGWELVLIVFVLILLFGAKKLPDLARGTGRALRIFKSETRGLMDDEDDKGDKDDGKTDERDNDRPRQVTTGDSTDTPSEATSQPTSQQGEQPNPTHRPYGS